MIDIDDKIEEMRQLAEQFRPAVMNGRVPERENIQQLASALHDVLCWIKEHDPAENRTDDAFARRRDL